MAQDDDILVRRLVEEQGGLSHQGIEPAPGLIHGLGDELGRELLFKEVLVFKRIVVLGEWHGAGIEPAVNDLGYPVHGLPALGTLICKVVNIGTVQLHGQGIFPAGLFFELCPGPDRLLVAAVLTFPDIQRGAPVAVSGNTPVLDILQPLAEAAFPDALGNPVHGIVVRNEFVLHGRHLDEPGGAGIVDERGIATPAVGVLMLKLGGGKEKLLCGKILQNFGIRADSPLLHFLLRRLAAHSGERRLGLHPALVINHLHQREVIVPSDPGIVFTEGRSDMDNAGTVGHGDIGVAGDEECFAMGLKNCVGRALVEGLIFPMLEFGTLVCLQSLIGRLAVLRERSEHGICQGLSQDIGIAVGGLDLHIGLVRVHTEGDIRGQGPGGRGPCQIVEVLVLGLEADDGGPLLQGLIALSHFLGGKRGSAAGAVGNDLEALVEKALLPDLLQGPPLGLDEIVIIGNVGVLHVGPESDLTGELLPHALVLPDRLLALLDEGLHPVGFDLFLPVQTQFLLDRNLDGQAMGIPAGLPGNVLPLHGLVAGNHILDDPGQDMADMGLAIGGRGAVIEGIGLPLLPAVHALFEDVMGVPILLNFLLPVHEVQVRVYFSVHRLFSNPFLYFHADTYGQASRRQPQ